jgi:tRNA-specific 2-thiouridylase
VVIGKEEDLWQQRLSVREMHWLAGTEPALPHAFQVKIRYRHGAAPALVSRNEQGGHTIRFADPQRAITPGQIAALYLGDEVIGSGAIDP